jgi:hypothetical protein
LFEGRSYEKTIGWIVVHEENRVSRWGHRFAILPVEFPEIYPLNARAVNSRHEGTRSTVSSESPPDATRSHDCVCATPCARRRTPIVASTAAPEGRCCSCVAHDDRGHGSCLADHRPSLAVLTDGHRWPIRSGWES